MHNHIPENLIALANACKKPLYVVGGSVRDFLADYPLGENTDWDISSPMSEEEVLTAAEKCGFLVRAVYRHTGTVKLEDGDGRGYEFTRFRSDKYVRGEHTPAEIEFTDDIECDARRRDFCANAVYYDVKNGVYADPLGGMSDIAAKKLRTVREAERVFGEDGLRLMRLARIAAETGFMPDGESIAGAARNAVLISDIAPERIFAELRALLHADLKHGDPSAPYRGLCILRKTGVLGHTMPELTLGDGMPQRIDFHKYDVLEHSFRCVMYAPPEIRFAALLHDVGKPFSMLRDGNFHAHPEEGARIAAEILHRLKAPKSLTDETAFLVKEHMRDFDCRMKPNKVRRELRSCGKLLSALLALKQADFSACTDDMGAAPTVIKWKNVYDEMRAEGVPFTVKELALGGRDVQALGIPPRQTATVLNELLDFCLFDGARNTREILTKHVLKIFPQSSDQ